MKPEFVAVNSIITWQPMMKANNNTVRLQNMIVITAASPNQIAAMIEALPEFVDGHPNDATKHERFSLGRPRLVMCL